MIKEKSVVELKNDYKLMYPQYAGLPYQVLEILKKQDGHPQMMKIKAMESGKHVVPAYAFKRVGI